VSQTIVVLTPTRGRKGDEHPAYTPVGVWHTLPLLFTCNVENGVSPHAIINLTQTHDP